jgi:hypothetical protein
MVNGLYVRVIFFPHSPAAPSPPSTNLATTLMHRSMLGSTRRLIDRSTPRDTKVRARKRLSPAPRTPPPHLACCDVGVFAERAWVCPWVCWHRCPLHGLFCPPLHHQLVVAVLGWYPWAVICSHGCALANERPAPRPVCVRFSPHHQLFGLCHACVFFASASRHSLSLSTSFHPDDDAPNDARPRWCADPRLTCSTRRPIDVT